MMNRIRQGMPYLLIATLGLLSSVIAYGAPAPTLLGTIEAQYSDGTISIDERALLVVTSIMEPSALSEDYLTLSQQAQMQPSRCATPALKEVFTYWDELAPSTQEAIRTLLLRPDGAIMYDSPGGFFRLHYDTLPAGNGVSPEDTDLTMVPDFIEKIAAYLDTTVNHHAALGYRMPPSDGTAGGNERYDIYFQQSANYGVCVPEQHGPEDWNDRISYVVLHRNFLGFAENDDPEGDQYGAAKVTAAHEFHHAVQYAYDFSEDSWFQELDAVHIEEIIFDATNDCYNYLDDLFDYPEKSLMESSLHAYSCFPYGLYIAQKFDTSVMRAAWEGSLYATTVFDALSDTLLTEYGWSQDSAFAEFAMWNYITNIRDDGLHHEEAAAYPLAATGRSYTSYPVQVTNSPVNPSGYGCCYVDFYPELGLSTLELMFNGSDSFEWAAWLIKSTSENQHVIEKMEVLGPTYVEIDTILNFESYYRITLVGVNLSEFGSSGPFSYSANTFAPYEVSVEAINDDSAIYSGGVRPFGCRVSNVSPLNDVFNLIVFDTRGWLPLDTLLVPVLASSDSLVYVDVTVPEGTPL